MKKYENGAVLLQNNIVLEDEEITIYEELVIEVEKLRKNVDGLGKQALPNGEIDEIRAKGLEILMSNYGNAYQKLIKSIGGLANKYIRTYCFNLLFYKDAADMMLVSPLEMITGFISERKSDMQKAIFTDYSVNEFTEIVNEIREKVTALAIMNWQKHGELNKRK